MEEDYTVTEESLSAWQGLLDEIDDEQSQGRLWLDPDDDLDFWESRV